jgi:phenylalanyl-tRNA synthetase beta chain
MRVPLSWLREFAPIDLPAEAVADTLSNLGLVVESTEVVPAPYPGIVVARVLQTGPHPAADRIQLVQVDAGDGEALQICCGAFNMSAGDLVPLATLGTVMPDGLEIARRKMRGEWSNGMLCSASELGLPDTGEKGIFILTPALAPPGTPLAEALGLAADVVFDLEISPNRPDALSVAGVARDLAAALDLPFAMAEHRAPVDESLGRAEIDLQAGAEAACPQFTATVIDVPDGLTTPPWMARRLTLAGMRPISATVDASNYVMLELGRPNHAYDRSRLGGGGLRVRLAQPGEQLVTLDGVTRTLEPSDCVIADLEDRPQGLAGIMGGQEAGIESSSTTVVLEVAWFEPLAIARTGVRTGLFSEARARFERGVDPAGAERAVDRFVSLLPGARRGPLVVREAPELLPPSTVVELRTARVNLLLGTELGDAAVAGALQRLGFELVAGPPDGSRSEAGAGGAGVASFRVPSWRPDCTREVDLVEEVARLYGYRHLPRTIPPRPSAQVGLTAGQQGRRRVRDLLVGAGFSEAWTSAFASPQTLQRVGLEPAAGVTPVEVVNPLDQSHPWLRTSLVPGLVQAVRFNTDRQAGALRLFELGKVFAQPGSTRLAALAAAPADGLPAEDEHLAALAVGPEAGAELAARLWSVLAGGLRLASATLEAVAETDPGTWAAGSVLHAGRRAAIVVDGQRCGVLGELAPDVAVAGGLPGRPGLLLVDVAALVAGQRRDWAAQVPSRYPATDLDLAFVVPEAVPATTVGHQIGTAAGEMLESLALFDIWRGASLDPGTRSLAFRLRLRAEYRTLTDEEVAEVRTRVIAEVGRSSGGTLRA